MIDNATIRAKARAQLGGGIFKDKWLIMLLVCLLYTTIGGIVSSIPVLGWIGTLVVGGPLMYGLYKAILETVEGEKPKFESLIHGFTEDFSGNMILGLLQTLFVFLWTLLFIIPGIVKTYAYAMAFYLKRDCTKMGVTKEAKTYLDESSTMMEGHKMQLFLLDLSFFGWYFLGVLCFGVGTLFVVPYHEMARANFYKELCAENTPVIENTESENSDEQDATQE